ncbi:MAG TPA: BadF/BadG/BcrA/BcrD ATPase family protein [Rhizomicrobium sp.]|jgi:glucosamine kinase
MAQPNRPESVNRLDQRVPLDRDNASPGRRWFVGVDGGGSGCRAKIADTDGNILGEGRASPAALRLGIDRSLAAVESACELAAADAGLPLGALRQMDAVVGLAGLGRKGLLEALIARPYPFRSVRYVNDATIACLGTYRGCDGGVVIVGTGSVGLAIIDGREIRVGGYGFPIGDEGSGAALGLAALRIALRAYDGRTPKTRLASELLDGFHNDPFEVIAWMDEATATDYATFAPLVLDLAEQGDAAAEQIVRLAAQAIDEIAFRLIACGTPRLALLGGLAPRMQPFLAPDVRAQLMPSMGDATDGALLLARGVLPDRAAMVSAPG